MVDLFRPLLANLLPIFRRLADVFDTAADPATVKVNVRYVGNRYGLPSFPSPDPLKLGDRFVLSAESTYRLE